MTGIPPEPGFAEQAAEVIGSLRRGRLDLADALYQQLCEQHPRARGMLVVPVLLAIQRGRALDALQLVERQPVGCFPELRALCLQVLGDPAWHGEATALLDSPDPAVVLAMRQLLAPPATAA